MYLDSDENIQILELASKNVSMAKTALVWTVYTELTLFVKEDVSVCLFCDRPP